MFARMPDRRFDVVIVGAGPAGIAAACVACDCGATVAVIDDNPVAGGQIWRGGAVKAHSSQANRWLARLAGSGTTLFTATRVIDRAAPGKILALCDNTPLALGYQKLIVATGARELFLPFPGWTLPNVMGAGGLEALVRSGLPVAGKRVVVAGSGPLLLAVAAELVAYGANVPVIAEQALPKAIRRFAFQLARDPAKLAQAAALKWRLRGVKYATSTWPVSAKGQGRLEAVVLRSGERTWHEPCDYLAVGFGLVPNLELPLLLGCRLNGGFVSVDEWQQTSVRDIYCAGEPTGIGGVDLALTSGQIAGAAAAGYRELARRWFPERAHALRFKDTLATPFQLREQLRSIAQPDTLVCRCEDVPLSRIREHESWRAAKLQTRCGMGPCQGRICGPAVEFLTGWPSGSVRPPVFPARVQDLCARDL
jgi:NADPH-dependent 2,4-dienoyl-CoA reductase/sulfur reductase-like enzyme